MEETMVQVEALKTKQNQAIERKARAISRKQKFTKHSSAVA